MRLLHQYSIIALSIIIGFGAVPVFAWTGPSQTAPAGNVSPPVNIGSTLQYKSGDLAVERMVVYGNSLLEASSYLNWGTIFGTSGYGIRDNAGTLEFKNSGGTWASLQSTISTLTGGASVWTTSGTNIYNNNSGNVGVGISTPTGKLDVGGRVHVDYSSPFYGVSIEADTLGGWTRSFNFTRDSDNATLAGFGGYGAANALSYLWMGPSYTAPWMIVNSSGNVGIGTVAPAHRLDVITPNASDAVNTGIQVSRAVSGTSPLRMGNYFKSAENRSGGTIIANESLNLIYNQGAGAQDFNIFNSTADTDVDTAVPVLTADQSGNVGIGVASPTYKLDVQGGKIHAASGFVAATKNDAGAIASGSGFFQSSTPVNYYTGASGWQHLIESRHTNDTNNYALQIAGAFGDQELYFRKTNNSATTAWNKFIYANSTGNVGIGTVPTTRLDVSGGSLKVLGNATGVFNFRDSTAASNFGTWYRADGTAAIAYLGGALGAALSGGTANDFVIRAPAGNLILYADSGNVGIGTVSPAAKLDVNAGNIRVTGTGDVGNGFVTVNESKTALTQANQWTAWNMTGAYGNKLGFYAYSKTSACAGGLCSNPFSIYDDGHIHMVGNVGIGTTNPVKMLDVVGEVQSSGSIYAPAFLYNSDRRLKEGIKALKNGIPTIMALSPVSFLWKKDVGTVLAGTQDIGFIAQEVEQVIPEVVHTDEKGMKSVDYIKVVPLLVQAMQEQQKQIDDLKAELRELKAQ